MIANNRACNSNYNNLNYNNLLEKISIDEMHDTIDIKYVSDQPFASFCTPFDATVSWIVQLNNCSKKYQNEDVIQAAYEWSFDRKYFEETDRCDRCSNLLLKSSGNNNTDLRKNAIYILECTHKYHADCMEKQKKYCSLCNTIQPIENIFYKNIKYI